MPMRLVVAGSRTIHDAALLAAALAESGFAPTAVLHGGSPGVDALAHDWATARGLPVEAHPPADDTTEAKHARNRHMVAHADALVALWDPASDDTTLHAVREALARGLPVALRATDGRCWRTPGPFPV